MRWAKLKQFLLGSPLATAQEHVERLTIPLALAVFASDALSSTAYATEEILMALVASAFATVPGLMQWLAIPVALTIVLLLMLVVFSYFQVIKAYPQGGGSYEVARENLGPLPSQVAAAALMIDYVLTVAVSVSAGVAALTSAGWLPAEKKVLWALLAILLLTLINLRGVRESARVFAWPAYSFIAIMAFLLIFGFWQVSQGNSALGATGFSLQTFLEPWQGVQAVTQQELINTAGSASLALGLLMLNAFAHGCAALTGIEAISNGVQAFKPPESKHANQALLIMGCLLATIFLGITGLAFAFHVTPSHDQTVISQIGRAVFGSASPLYAILQALTTIILILAANTSFSGFPRLAHMLAYDGLLPRQLKSLGDRLVYSNGIILLGALAGFLVVLYHADTHSLIPLYAVGVFLCFSLAQFGMVQHHRKVSPHRAEQRKGLLINGLGAIVTAAVTLILAIEKFAAGAWIVIVAIPLMVWVFRSIQKHYMSVGTQLLIPENMEVSLPFRQHKALVLVSSLNQGTLLALSYAKALTLNVEAVHIELDEASTQRLRERWHSMNLGEVPLTVLRSPYRSIVGPLLNYINDIEKATPETWVTIVIPEFVPKKWWHSLLHNQTAWLLKAVLVLNKERVVTTVRHYLTE